MARIVEAAQVQICTPFIYISDQGRLRSNGKRAKTPSFRELPSKRDEPRLVSYSPDVLNATNIVAYTA